MMNLVRTGGVLLIVLVALFLAWRSAKKAGVARYPVPACCRPGRCRPMPSTPRSAPSTGPAIGNAAVGVDPATPGRSVAARRQVDSERAALPSAARRERRIAELIDRQPEEVASILRGWLADRRA